MAGRIRLLGASRYGHPLAGQRGEAVPRAVEQEGDTRVAEDVLRMHGQSRQKQNGAATKIAGDFHQRRIRPILVLAFIRDGKLLREAVRRQDRGSL